MSACPFVAGVAALYLNGHPTASHDDVRASLLCSATNNVLTHQPPSTANRLLYANVQPCATTTSTGDFATTSAAASSLSSAPASSHSPPVASTSPPSSLQPPRSPSLPGLSIAPLGDPSTGDAVDADKSTFSTADASEPESVETSSTGVVGAAHSSTARNGAARQNAGGVFVSLLALLIAALIC